MKASTVTIPVKKNHMEIHWHDYADKENPGSDRQSQSGCQGIRDRKSRHYDARLRNRSLACAQLHE